MPTDTCSQELKGRAPNGRPFEVPFVWWRPDVRRAEPGIVRSRLADVAIVATAGPALGQSMVVYDAAGRTVRTLVQGAMSAGQHQQAWDGTNDAGHSLAAGIYFVRFEAGSFLARQRIVLLH